MTIIFKMTRELVSRVRTDLDRPHEFAAERVGFISAGVSSSGGDLYILARDYRPVADEDYLRDASVGAMMGSEALRKALQWAMSGRQCVFNVHTHGGVGVPRFSGIDLRESAKFVPDFFNVAKRRPHGALVLSNTAAFGKVWTSGQKDGVTIDRFVEVGSPLRKWSVR